MTGPIPDRVARRAIKNYVLDVHGCHLSLYAVSPQGYPMIGWRPVLGVDDPADRTTAHRAAWTAVHGPIPAGMTVDHKCKTKRCVNVRHLRLLSNFENARRTNGRDWPLGECAHGHKNDQMVTLKSGKRRCAPCALDATRRYRAKRRAREQLLIAA